MDRTALLETALAIAGAFPLFSALLLAANAALDFKVPRASAAA